MILADSSRQTASTARCTSGTVINRIRASPAAAPQSGAAGLSGPYTWRIAPSPLPAICQKRLASSIASSLDRTSTRAKLRMVSLDSVNGPSVTVIFPPEEVTRVPSGSSPPAASSTPFLVISSTSRSISATSLSSGGSALEVVIRNRIVVSLASLGRAPLAHPLMLRTAAAGIDIPGKIFSTSDAPDVETGPAAPSCW